MKRLLLTLALTLGMTLPAEAVTYYTAKTGSDSNSCTQAQSTATPKLTIAAGVGCLTAAGDKLQIRDGTYAESLDTNVAGSPFALMPSGASWNNPVTIMGYPGDPRPILKPAPLPRSLIRILGSAHRYIIFRDLVLDGDDVDAYVLELSGTAGYVRVENCEVKNSNSSGVYLGKDSHHHEILKSTIHTNGVAPITGGCWGVIKSAGGFQAASCSSGAQY